MGVFAVLAVLGGGHAILSFFSSPPPGPSEDSTTRIIAHEQLAQSYARDFVVTYLSATSGQQDKLAEYVSSGQQVTLPSIGRQITDGQVVYAARMSASEALDVWTVTVSVRVAKGAAIGGDKQFYRVAVSVADGRLRALSLPEVVGPPLRGDDLMLGYQTTCSPDTPLTQVAAGFLAAYAAGNGDVARYVTPDSGITALHPSPYSAMDVATVMADDSGCGASSATAHVLASVNPKADGGVAPSLAFPLTMVRTGGQWQVQAMDSVPYLRSPMTVVTGQQAGRDAAAASSAAKPTASAVQVPPATQN
ncbi:conjugal transfer protein [Nocardia sp. alder85J]|uniref:conjugal transfer protein n=1 Tax=Nocardia sp. alder85J TaxID=2862949 RepID=UPI001CD4AC13|nr:conjugal transfer protein [Nocardia sp. alder85J]MCX4092164.1 conjugal transfer protein [Nocardia sp. alder85J]